MNSFEPIHDQTKPQAPPETDPKTGQEEVIKEQPVPFDPNQRPTETPPLPGEGPLDPESPDNIPTPDPTPGREERIGFRIGENVDK